MPAGRAFARQPAGYLAKRITGTVRRAPRRLGGPERSRRRHAVSGGGTFMRRTRHFGVPAGLGAGLLGSAALVALGAATGGAALAAVADSGGATGLVNPGSATPGSSVTFQILCGSDQATSAILFGTTLGLPEQIPMDAESGGAAFSATVTLPAGLRPGSYSPDMDCSDGSAASATLTVTALPASGGAQTGDGTTSTQTNDGIAIAGLAMVGLGFIIGGVAIRRNTASRRQQ
jgi:hypothetical protein